MNSSRSDTIILNESKISLKCCPIFNENSFSSSSFFIPSFAKVSIAVIGPSGSGKSTFLRCLNHLETIDSGRIDIEGDTLVANNAQGQACYVADAEVRRICARMGMVFQHFNLFPHLTVLENIIAAPLTVTPTELVVGFEPGSVVAAQAAGKEAVAALTRAASEHFGARVHVVVELDSERSRGFDTLAQQQVRERRAKVQHAIAEAKRHPRVVDAMEVLGARLKDLKLASD